ncbi:putative mitochondrial protein AtMg00860 [Tasmannia lanceolata]|uniref:putative mitochondrial protein AtMg00860 n=1 Tax=Tasmannia lanceolata TaxID=3420 RepID=UPI0040634647
MRDAIWSIQVLGDALRFDECAGHLLPMNSELFHEHLDRFVVVYLDDIVVYSRTIEEHVAHLRTIFRILRENHLYVKKEKSSFAQEEIMFLGHSIVGGEIGLDQEKVRAIQEWQAPEKVTELRSFLGLVNYYRRFIPENSHRAAPLTDLLKKDRTVRRVPAGIRWPKDCGNSGPGTTAARSCQAL